MSDKPSLVSDVTVINCINIGRDHMMVLGYTRSDVVSIAKQAKKQTKTKISSPTRAIMKKRREMIEGKKQRPHVEIRTTTKSKQGKIILKYNLD